MFWSVSLSAAAQAADFRPTLKPGGGKFRIAYLEGGPYLHYTSVLKALVLNLAQLGWIDKPDDSFPAQAEDAREVWDWLSGRAVSRYLEFPADAFWSAGWDKGARAATRQEVLARLAGPGDIDAVLALGTWAGQDLANDEHRTPVLVFQTTDPVVAGIVKNASRSGRAHVFAHTDPERYRRQLRLFFDLFRFKTLGIAFEDSPDGKAYAAVADAEAVARERGFELVQCYTTTNAPDLREVVGSYLSCHRRLAESAEAMYLTHTRAMTLATLPQLLQPFVDRRRPTFAQGGDGFVRGGVLLSMAQTDFTALGRFFAETLGRVLNGAQPGGLEQVFEDPPTIAINLETARKIGYVPSIEVLTVASEVFGQ